MTIKRDSASSGITQNCEQLQRVCSEDYFHRIRRYIHDLNSRYYIRLKTVKDRKMASLRDAKRQEERDNNPTDTNSRAGGSGNNPSDADGRLSKLVVTIPPDMPLTDAEKSVLSKGLSFVPVKKCIDEYQAKADCENLYRRIRLKAHFHRNDDSDSQPTSDIDDPFAKFNPKDSTWTPPDGKFSAVDHYIDCCRRAVNAVNFKARSQQNNLSPTERAALLQLSARSDIVIKPADKGGAVVVWSRPLYIAEANRQLSDERFYERIDHDPIKENQFTVKSAVNAMIAANELPPSAKNLIVPTPKTSKFYLLPKIHKTGNPGRPIVSACSCPTENIAAYLDRIMCPIVRNLNTYIKDTNHVLNIFNDFRFDDNITGERFLYSMDIKSLYTVIPNNSGLESLAYFLDKRSVLEPPTSTLTSLAELVLILNAFTFNGDFYKQIGGVAMGSKMGPNYACLFVGYIEEQIASQYTGFVPQLHKRYIDDVLGVACCSRLELENYISFVSNFHPALQFTHTISDTELSFLDMTLRITNDYSRHFYLFQKAFL